MRLNDPELVRRQYASEDGLAVRRDFQRRFREGPDAFDTAFEAVAESQPRRVLEVGCGMGNFAERLARETSAEVVATDLSPRMVEVARERGHLVVRYLVARVAEHQLVPFLCQQRAAVALALDQLGRPDHRSATNTVA